MSVQTRSEAGPAGRTAARRLGADPRDALALARRAWSLPTAGGTVTVRGAVPGDLRGVALMHGRCSAQTLLQRYLRGGSAPSLPVLSALLHQPLVVLATTADGDVVGLASGTRPAQLTGRAAESARTLQLGLVVQDDRQRQGIGRALAAHVAASAVLLGHRELVADVSAQGLPLRRILDGLGDTRSSRHPGGSRIRTRVDVRSLGGLGSVTAVLAG